MPAKLVANGDGRRLTHSRPDVEANSSASLLRSPRYRDGCREKSSSALIADNATRRRTPSRCACCTTDAISSPSARELRNTADAPGIAAAAVSTTFTSAGNPAASGRRLTARTSAPAATSSATNGRPTLPVAPVTTIVMIEFLSCYRPGLCAGPPQGRHGGRESYPAPRVTFWWFASSYGHDRPAAAGGVAAPPPVCRQPRVSD